MSSELHFWGKQFICMQIFILPGKLYQRSWKIIQLIPWFQMGKATGMMHLIQMCLCAHQFSLVWLLSPFPPLFSLCILLRWGAMDAEAYSETSKNLIQTFWSIGTYKKNNAEADHLWIKARGTAFHSLSHYKVLLHFVVLLSASPYL